MRHSLPVFFPVLLCLLCLPGPADAVEVRINPWNGLNRSNKILPLEGPGTAPENAFPLVCYVVGKPRHIELALIEEAKHARDAAAQGKTIARPLAEKYAAGLSWPAYLGYFVVDATFRITYVSELPAWWTASEVEDLNREKPGIDLKVPRWSWHGVLGSLYLLARGRTVVYTLGVPPDPGYVPKARGAVLVPLAEILNPGSTTSAFWDDQDIDTTIINLKPGMHFKVIDGDFTIP